MKSKYIKTFEDKNSDINSKAYICEIDDGTENWEVVIISEEETDVQTKAAEEYGNVNCRIIKSLDWF